MDENLKQYEDDDCIQKDGQSKSIFDPECVISYDALWDSMMKCKRNVGWKDSVAHFILNGALEIAKLSKELHDGTYEPKGLKNLKYIDRKNAILLLLLLGIECFKDL